MQAGRKPTKLNLGTNLAMLDKQLYNLMIMLTKKNLAYQARQDYNQILTQSCGTSSLSHIHIHTHTDEQEQIRD
jgi:hypothetical protein